MFRDLSALIKAGRNRTSAIRAIRQIPKQDWQKDQARPLVDNLTAYLTEIPARYRTGAVAMDALGSCQGTRGAVADRSSSSLRGNAWKTWTCG